MPRLRRVATLAALTALGFVALVLLVATGFFAYAETQQTQDRHDAAPPTGRFVDAGDVEMFVQERGPPDGPAVVLVHGTGAWSQIYAEELDALAAEGYRAIALDLPPFGYSEKPRNGSYTTPDQARRILGVLDALDLRDATLVGHSFASRATMEAVLTRPERVGAVVLVDPALDLSGEPRSGNLLLGGVLAFPPTRALFVASTVENPLLTRVFLEQLVHVDAAATDERIDMLQRPLVIEGLTRDAGLWLRTFLAPEAPNRASNASAYAALDLPVLLVWGSEDTVTPVAQAERLQALLPRAQLVVLDGVGHIPHVEDPARFHAALRTFLDSVR